MVITDSAASPKAFHLVGEAQVRQLIGQATNSPRMRSHLLLHGGPEDQVQRLLIAAEPATYVRPHKHSQQWEMLALHRGSLDVLIFDETGKLLDRAALNPASPVVQIQMSHWHNCVVREANTMILEIKPGPYRPNEFANWAPAELDQQAANYVRWAASAKPGQTWQPG